MHFHRNEFQHLLFCAFARTNIFSRLNGSVRIYEAVYYFFFLYTNAVERFEFSTWFGIDQLGKHIVVRCIFIRRSSHNGVGDRS